VAAADSRELISLSGGRQIVPDRIAPADAGAPGIGPWQPYQPGGIAQAGLIKVFDSAEVTPTFGFGDGASTGGYEPPCFDFDGDGTSDSPGSRYYGGLTYCLPQYVNDMTIDSQYGGELYVLHFLPWFWYVNGPGTAEPCYVVTYTANGFDDTGAGPPATDYNLGYTVQFAGDTDLDGDGTNESVDSGAEIGWYYALIDLTGIGGRLLPLDAQGSWHTIFARDVQDTAIYLATCAQPMIWGVKPDAPGNQNEWQWDDDLTCTGSVSSCSTDCTAGPDGVFTPFCEFYDYSWDGCPNPRCPATAFWIADGCSEFRCADANCDDDVNNADIPAFVQALTDPDGWAQTHPDCDLVCVGDTNGDGSFNNADIPGFVYALTSGNGECP